MMDSGDNMTDESGGYQAYRERSNATIATRNGPLLRVIRPPNDQETDSKRTELIVNAEELLGHDMEDLKDATHVRNLEIQTHFVCQPPLPPFDLSCITTYLASHTNIRPLHRLVLEFTTVISIQDAINERSRHFEEKLGAEMKARDESIAELRAGVMRAFEGAFSAMEAKAGAAFDLRLNDTILAQDTRETNVQVHFHEFIHVTVPGIIEALQGTVTRRLDKSHETFDIDNTKLVKREKKMTNQVESHERKTAQAFMDEKDRRSTTFIALQEGIHTTMRTDDRQAEKKQNGMIDTIVALKSQYDEERRVREAEDAELLEKVSSAMERLHRSILDSFGEVKDMDDGRGVGMTPGDHNNGD
ncbi:hypothetical protein DYB26_003918 [Aphanomyces astaci]|uniref:Uncharacterized protein n=3 Tax=Aphanomyces astaci TaxID=112090 RepID=A0A3R6ZYW7_APHAT|nr:hypothetical protein DYB26_003918 [Aphanomyces astaci]